jgi:hypothetical protein
MNQNDKQRAWFIELKEDQIKEEINYLRSEIYNSSINIPIEVFDAYSRFSNHYGNSQNTAKYQDKIEMVKMLCLK